MRATSTLELERRARSHIEWARRGESNCINTRIKYEVHSCDYENQSVTLRFEIEDWMMNPGNILHGGMMSTMLDITMGIGTLTLSGFYCFTVNMSISFLEPVKSGDVLLITARATRIGQTFVQLVGEAYSEKMGKVAATSTGVFVLSKEKIVIPEEK